MTASVHEHEWAIGTAGCCSEPQRVGLLRGPGSCLLRQVRSEQQRSYRCARRRLDYVVSQVSLRPATWVHACGRRAGDAPDRQTPGSATGEWGTGWGQRSGLSCVPHRVHAQAVHSNWEAPSGFCRVPRGCGNTAGTHRGEARRRFSPRNADVVRPLHFLQEMPA
jgi:hypothetical protein